MKRVPHKILDRDYELVKIDHDLSYLRYSGAIALRDRLSEIIDAIPLDAVEVYVGLDLKSSYGYYDSIEIEFKVPVRYWIPLTAERKAEKEEQRKKTQAAARKAAKTKRENKKKEELALLEKLKAKYEKTS